MIAKMEKQETKRESKSGVKHDSKLEVAETVKEFEAQLRKDVDAKAQIILDYENTLKRLQADFENTLKRTHKEKEDYAKVAVAKVLIRFVDIADDFDRALNILEKTQEGEVKTGIKMVHNRFHKILSDEGIKSFDSKGRKLDPFMHEVIEMVSSEGPEGVVVEEVQKGYVMKDKVLRAAKVKVSKSKGVKN